MAFFALFTSNSNSNKSASKQRRERRTGPPPAIRPRESSLYSSNFGAAASAFDLPSYGAAGRTQSSFALSSPRPHTVYHDSYARGTFSSVEVSRVPEHSPSAYQSLAVFEEEDIFTPRFAIPTEDFAHGGKVNLSRRSPLRTKKWATASVIGFVKRRMNGNNTGEDVRYSGDEWPQDSQFPEEHDDMVPPPLPSKSALRGAATGYTSSMIYQLPVDPPNDTPPSLSSASSDDGHAQTSPDIRTPATSTEPSWGRKNRPDSRDPHRVRDGAPTKESSSGVYTPTTFPGAHGPRPSHFPSHVYTPGEYPGPAGPSRSSSISSSSASGSDRSSPRTPQSPASPRWSTASISSGFKRLSTTFTSLAPGKAEWSSSSTSPAPAFPFQPPITEITWDGTPRQAQSPQTSYYTSLPGHAKTNSWTSTDGGALGFAVPASPPANRNRYSVAEVTSKRKPVPKIDDVQVEIDRLGIDREDSRTPTAAR